MCNDRFVRDEKKRSSDTTTRDVRFRADNASALLRRNLAIYGLGGLVVPFLGIKLIDLLIVALGVS